MRGRKLSDVRMNGYRSNSNDKDIYRKKYVIFVELLKCNIFLNITSNAL